MSFKREFYLEKLACYEDRLEVLLKIETVSIQGMKKIKFEIARVNGLIDRLQKKLSIS